MEYFNLCQVDGGYVSQSQIRIGFQAILFLLAEVEEFVDDDSKFLGSGAFDESRSVTRITRASHFNPCTNQTIVKLQIHG